MPEAPRGPSRAAASKRPTQQLQRVRLQALSSSSNLLLLLLLQLLLLLLGEARCCCSRLAFQRRLLHLPTGGREGVEATSFTYRLTQGPPTAASRGAPSGAPLPRRATHLRAAHSFAAASDSQADAAAATAPEPALGATAAATAAAATPAETAAGAAAAAPPAAETAAGAAAAAAGAAAAAEAAGVVGGRPRFDIGKRRREDRRLNWHRQYVYGPVDPTAAYRRAAAAAHTAASAAANSPGLLLQLQQQQRPKGRRWRLLEELEAGEEVLRAASSAAREALDVLLIGDKAEGGASKREGGPWGGPRPPRRRAGAARQAEVSVHLQLRRAALRAAAEAITKELGCMQQQSDPLEEDREDREEVAAAPAAAAAAGSGSPEASEASRGEDGGGAPPANSRRWGPRTVYARALRQLLLQRAKLRAAAESREAEGGPPSASAAAAAQGPPLPPCRSAAEAPADAAAEAAGRQGESPPPLLAALLPREGVTLDPSSGLLICQLLSTAAFDETIEVHVHLKRRASRGQTRSRGTQRIQGFVTLPHGVIPSLSSSSSSSSSSGGGGGGAGAAAAREVRGKKKGGIWRRPRVIAAIVEPAEEEAAKAAGKQTAANTSSSSSSTQERTPAAAAAAAHRSKHQQHQQQQTGADCSRHEQTAADSSSRQQHIAADWKIAADSSRVQQRADIVGVEALLEALEGAPLQGSPGGLQRAPDVVICTPEMMATLSAHGKALGERNLIPSLAMGTLTEDPVAAIRVYRQPTIQFRADRLGVVHAPIGYASMESPQLLANFRAFVKALKAAACAAAPGSKQQGVGALNKLANCMHVCSTMGPSVAIDLRAC
ncbi:hypothetical protein Efla_003574 [Eimeria flavescens]